MQVTYQLTAEDYYQGLLALRNRRAWSRWLLRIAYLIVALALVLCVVDSFLERNTSRLQTSLAGAVFAILWLGFMWLGPRFSARRQFRNSPSSQSPVTVNASETGLEILSAHGESKVSWTAFMAWSERRTVFIILPQPRIYYAIPKRAFTERQLTEFREMLRHNVGKK
jgi:hypothetical protein